MFTEVNNFLTWLQRELDRRNWNRADLARAAGISKSALSMIYSEDRQPGPDLCLAISSALHIPPETVFIEAGLFPEKKRPDALAERLAYLMEQLDQEDREEIIDIAELKIRRKEKYYQYGLDELERDIEAAPTTEEKLKIFEKWLVNRGAEITEKD